METNDRLEETFKSLLNVIIYIIYILRWLGHLDTRRLVYGSLSTGDHDCIVSSAVRAGNIDVPLSLFGSIEDRPSLSALCIHV